MYERALSACCFLHPYLMPSTDSQVKFKFGAWVRCRVCRYLGTFVLPYLQARQAGCQASAGTVGHKACNACKKP